MLLLDLCLAPRSGPPVSKVKKALVLLDLKKSIKGSQGGEQREYRLTLVCPFVCQSWGVCCFAFAQSDNRVAGRQFDAGMQAGVSLPTWRHKQLASGKDS